MDPSPHSAPLPAARPREPRVFFALVPDGECRARIAQVAERCAQRAGGRATAPGSLHLTLAVLGGVPTDRLPALMAIGVGAPRLAFELVLDTVGEFRRARIAWIAPSSIPAALLALREALAAALLKAPFAIDERPFRPHVTLARKCDASLAKAAVLPLRWPVARLSLMASTLDPAGALYRELSGWALEPSPTPDARWRAPD